MGLIWTGGGQIRRRPHRPCLPRAAHDGTPYGGRRRELGRRLHLATLAYTSAPRRRRGEEKRTCGLPFQPPLFPLPPAGHARVCL